MLLWVCINKRVIDLDVEIRLVKTICQFHVVERLSALYIVGVDASWCIRDRGIG